MSWIKGLTRTQNARDLMQELAHGSHRRDHLGLAVCEQALIEGTKSRIVTHCAHRREVQGLANAGMTVFGERRGTVN